MAGMLGETKFLEILVQKSYGPGPPMRVYHRREKKSKGRIGNMVGNREKSDN